MPDYIIMGYPTRRYVRIGEDWLYVNEATEPEPTEESMSLKGARQRAAERAAQSVTADGVIEVPPQQVAVTCTDCSFWCTDFDRSLIHAHVLDTGHTVEVNVISTWRYKRAAGGEGT